MKISIVSLCCKPSSTLWSNNTNQSIILINQSIMILNNDCRDVTRRVVEGSCPGYSHSCLQACSSCWCTAILTDETVKSLQVYRKLIKSKKYIKSQWKYEYYGKETTIPGVPVSGSICMHVYSQVSEI